jgi:hypothetical protein
MGDFTRYVARTEAWARQIENDTEEVVGSTGRVTAYKGDFEVKQNLRGQMFNYVMTEEDFREDWVLADEKDTASATSESGDVSELKGALPPSTEGDNPVDEQPPSKLTSAPTGGAPFTETLSETPAETNPDIPTASAPVGSGASQETQQEAPEEAPEEPTQPPPTTPTQSDAPAQQTEVGESGATVTTSDEGGDAGHTPTPSPMLPGEENAEPTATEAPSPADEGSAASEESAADPGNKRTLPGKRQAKATESSEESTESSTESSDESSTESSEDDGKE